MKRKDQDGMLQMLDVMFVALVFAYCAYLSICAQ